MNTIIGDNAMIPFFTFYKVTPFLNIDISR